MQEKNKQNTQGGNMSIVAAFVIVVAIIGSVIYVLMNKPTDSGTLADAIKTPTTTGTTSSQETKSQTITNQDNKKPMDTNKRLLQNFTPVAHVATLEKKDLVVGTGAEVLAGATVSVHYTGAVAATGEVFQSSKDFGTTPITFPLSGVIKGWTNGIPGMKVGGTRRLVIPADQAYGANPPGGSGIPANADLVFDVELVGIK